MPKIVDHQQRRAQVADAVRRVILEEGTDAATVRRVAAEAGWSAGALRHYFPDQAALLRFVVTLTFEEAPVRVARHLERAVGLTPGVDEAQGLLEEVLPLDDRRRVEMHVWLAAMDRSRHDPDMDRARRHSWLGIRQLSRIATSWVRRRSAITDYGRLLEHPLSDPEDERAAATLHALVDGLALHSFFHPEETDAGSVRDTLRTHLEQVARAAPAPAPPMSAPGAGERQ